MMRGKVVEMSREHPRSVASARALADWNRDVQPGTPVVVTRDDGSTLETRTRSRAWDLCGTPVVMVDGISGGYALHRVRVRTSEPVREP